MLLPFLHSSHKMNKNLVINQQAALKKFTFTIYINTDVKLLCKIFQKTIPSTYTIEFNFYMITNTAKM